LHVLLQYLSLCNFMLHAWQHLWQRFRLLLFGREILLRLGWGILTAFWWWLRDLNSPLKGNVGDSVVTGWVFFFLLFWLSVSSFVSSWVRDPRWVRKLVAWCVVVEFCGRKRRWWRKSAVSETRNSREI